MAVDLVIFDCDGVLVDSEPLAMRALIGTIAEAGLSIDMALGYERFLGVSLATTCAILSAEYGVDLTRDALERMRRRLNELIRRELRPVAGAHDVLDALPVPCCVASSSQPERLHLSLEVTGLAPRFDGRVFDATMVARGKPAPDLFLHAAGRMGAEPARCLVVEDSPAGIEAARCAGMPVYAFVGGGHAGEAHRRALRALKPNRIIDNLADLPDLIRRENAEPLVS